MIADLPVPFGFPRARRQLFESSAYTALEERIGALYRHDVIARIDGPDVAGGAGDRI